jgi:hypothetical protein
LFGCNSISMASLITRPMYLNLVDWILVSWSWTRCPRLLLFGYG